MHEQLLATLMVMLSTTLEQPPWARAMAVYGNGELLGAVHRSGLFSDSKTFVDLPMRHDPEAVLAAFAALDPSARGDAATMSAFVHEHFEREPGGELEAWQPPDAHAEPQLVRSLERSPELRAWAAALHQIWPQLARRTRVAPAETRARTSLLPRAWPVFVPGGRFRESYYWDSHWIVLGLLACSMRESATAVVRNLLADVQTYGHVPNGGRAYYLGRSQPPMLTEMALRLWAPGCADGDGRGAACADDARPNDQAAHREPQDQAVDDPHDQAAHLELPGPAATGWEWAELEQALPVLRLELEWWARNRAVPAPLEGPSLAQPSLDEPSLARPSREEPSLAHLSRYCSDDERARPEAHAEDEATAAASPEPARALRELRAAAESGWDFSARWLASPDAPVASTPPARTLPAERPQRGGEDTASTTTGTTPTASNHQEPPPLSDGQEPHAPSEGQEPRVRRLASIETSNLVPVDLNAILYRAHTALARAHRALAAHVVHASATDEDGRGGGVDGRHRAQQLLAHASALELEAERRRAAARRFLWVDALGEWRDYRLREQGPSPVVAVSSFAAPLWAGLVPAAGEEEARVLARLRTSGLLGRGGAAATTARTGEQWDHPNCWPPLLHMLVRGLDRQGRSGEARALGRQLGCAWLASAHDAWLRTGAMHEKYDADEAGGAGGGGEYEPQVGFGWSNGAALGLLVTYGAEPQLEAAMRQR
jgi:alpha,alpha-trehalase